MSLQNLKPRRPLVGGGRSLILASGVVLTLLHCGLSLLRPSFVRHLDGRFFDLRIGAAPRPTGYQDPVVVALDDESLARFGRWPWPRSLFAELLNRIAAQHPASVGIDVIFAESERAASAGSPRSPAGSRHPRSGPPHPAAATTGRLPPGDAALRDALARGPFVLGYEMTFAPKGDRAPAQPLPHPLPLVSLGTRGAADPASGFWMASDAVQSRREFSGSVSGAGFVNAGVEQDGVLRQMPILIRYQGKVYPSLALATVLKGLGSPRAVLSANWYGDCFLLIGARRIPLDDRGRLLLRYRGWHGAAKPLSAAAVLDGRLPPGALQGRLVFIGATATGMGETVTTPINALVSGVQVHAIAAENMVTGDLARRSPWLYPLLATVALGLLATQICLVLPVLPGALVLTGAAACAWQGSTWLYQSGGLFLSPVLPVLGLLANFTLLSAMRSFFVEKREQRQSRDLSASREFIMTSLAALTEIRDTETGAHIRRTQRYLLILCRELTKNPRFQPLLDEDTIELIAKLAPLHDIGKVGLSDYLLHKTSAFTAEEYEEVKKHAAYGRDTIARAEARAGIENDELLRYAKELAYSHHERWNGSGYPEGLRGEQIPWPGRVMAVADAYDAIISRRVYKEPVPHEAAVDIIMKGRGTLFDPDVVDAFAQVEDQWWQIACQLADPDRDK